MLQMKRAEHPKSNTGLFKKEHWHIFALIAIAIVSFGFNFYAISKTGYGNEYYAAAIKSMTQSFRNFFFVSFDPAGMVSVDKPPLGLWVQAVFVLIFGYHGWAMLLPQALAGTGSCLMLYLLTAKHFGRPAGLIASLIFAITPAAVVASRNNTIDMQLVLVLLAAAWFLFKAIEKSKWRYLFAAAVFIGLGFNIKMLQAYMILPAVVLVYLLFAKEKLGKRLLAGLISIAIMASVSFAWVIAVDLYPSGSRPYVDSSTNNTVWELILGHNGLERIYGQSTGGGQAVGGSNNDGGQPAFDNSNTESTASAATESTASGTTANASSGTSTATSGSNSTRQGSGTPPQMPSQQDGGGTPPSGSSGGPGGQRGGQGTGGQNSSEIGSAGVLRLWSSSLYGQASWLIVFALFAIIAAARKFNIRKLTLKQGVFVFWVLWLATMYAFFSFAGFYHRYYLCMLAPAVAALAGIGLVTMARAYRQKQGWKQFLLPLSLIATLAVEIPYVWSYPALRTWLLPVMAAAGAAALVLTAVHYFSGKRVALIAAAACMLLSILAAPCYWSMTPVMYVPNTTMPYAGPELASQGGGSSKQSQGSASSGTSAATASGLEQYLVKHYKAGSYLVVSQRASDVAQYIIDTGLPAVAYGGFLGSDNSLTVAQLKELVKEGKVTYFFVSGQSGSSSSDILSYVEQNATKIDASEYGGSSGQSGTLYCFE